jgi:DNA-binding transcriptional LysR family regulator
MRQLLPLEYIDTIARTGSIRKAAEKLAITSTALNRRVLAIEEELGVKIFERMPRGVRLSAAGEVLLHHIRKQLDDMKRVKGQISDLEGERRGHVSIACSQALLTAFLPEQIALYRKAHPAVTFSVHRRDRAAAEIALVDRSADLAMVFEPVRLLDFKILLTVRQPVFAIMSASHPLAKKQNVRLREYLEYPLALPSSYYGVRELLEIAVRRTSARLQPMVESDSFEFLRYQVLNENVITFHIEIGLPNQKHSHGLVYKKIDEQDIPSGSLYIGQLQGRTLPVAAARFINQTLEYFDQRFECS